MARQVKGVQKTFRLKREKKGETQKEEIKAVMETSKCNKERYQDRREVQRKE